MTDKPTPTDAELEALLLDKLPASKHYLRPVIEKMVAAMQAAIDKWGAPAQAAEPVAWLDPWAGTKATTDYDVYGKHGIPLYPHHPQLTQAQVGAREPLTETQMQKALMAYLQCSAGDLESYSTKLMDGYTADVQRILDAVFPMTVLPVAREPLPKFLALKFHARRDKKATVTLLFPGHEAADAWVRGIKGGQHVS